jgi:hypothetical protein
MYVGFHAKYLLFLLDFNETWILLTDFQKRSSSVILHQNLSSGSWFAPCGRTDKTKLIVTFCNFANTHKNVYIVSDLLLLWFIHLQFVLLHPTVPWNWQTLTGYCSKTPTLRKVKHLLCTSHSFPIPSCTNWNGCNSIWLQEWLMVYFKRRMDNLYTQCNAL